MSAELRLCEVKLRYLGDWVGVITYRCSFVKWYLCSYIRAKFTLYLNQLSCSGVNRLNIVRMP